MTDGKMVQRRGPVLEHDSVVSGGRTGSSQRQEPSGDGSPGH